MSLRFIERGKSGQKKRRHKPPITQKQAIQLTGKGRSWFYYHDNAFTPISLRPEDDKRTRLYYIDEIEELLGIKLELKVSNR